ncbi:MAG: YbbR-like domain-containing protein [Acetatifactor sp.]
MKKKIFHNWGLKLASLLLAFVIWFLVAKFGDPIVSVTFPNVQVTLKNTELLDNENKVFEVLDKTDTVRVTVRIPTSMRSQLRASDIVAEADMNKLTDINTIAISYYIPNVDADSIDGDHDFVRLSVEERMTKWIRVQSQIRGEVAENYMVAGTSSDQNLIEVSGAKSVIERVSYAGVEIDVSGATNNISMNVEPQLYDSNGELLELKGVNQNVGYIHMTVEVLATKEVPVEYTLTGTPAEGYMTTGVVETNPRTLKIGGTVSALAGVNRVLIPEGIIDITGRNSDLTVNLNLKDYLPEGIRLADAASGSRATITVYIEPRVEKELKLNAGNFEIINVPEGYTALLVAVEEGNTEEPVKVSYLLKVAGLQKEISAIQQSNVKGTVDVTEWMQNNFLGQPKTGVYEIPAIILLEQEVEILSEVQVRVILSKLEDL